MPGMNISDSSDLDFVLDISVSHTTVESSAVVGSGADCGPGSVLERCVEFAQI
jgi:hypothetical protein